MHLKNHFAQKSRNKNVKNHIGTMQLFRKKNIERLQSFYNLNRAYLIFANVFSLSSVSKTKPAKILLSIQQQHERYWNHIICNAQFVGVLCTMSRVFAHTYISTYIRIFPTGTWLPVLMPFYCCCHRYRTTFETNAVVLLFWSYKKKWLCFEEQQTPVTSVPNSMWQ